MEESKELQGFYKIFRAVIYISVLMEFFEYAIDLAMLDHWGGILIDIHGRIKRWMIYNDGNLVYSKIATFLLICITCIGTRNKKHLEFDARRQVLYPLICGLFLIVFSVWLYHHTMETRLYTLPLNIIFYMAATLVGVILVHIALDNISKFIKEGLGKDRFNFENESFEQSEEKDENQYSVITVSRLLLVSIHPLGNPDGNMDRHGFILIGLRRQSCRNAVGGISGGCVSTSIFIFIDLSVRKDMS